MRRATRLSLGIAVTVLATTWFVGKAQWAEIGAALRELHAGWVLAAAAVLYLEFVLRAMRWRVLLWELAPGAKLGPLFRATLIGMAMNVALPLRAGDLARPVLGARACGGATLPFMALSGVERVLDMLGLGAVFLAMLALLPGAMRGRGVLVENLEIYGAGATGMALFAFAALVAVAARRDRARAVLAGGIARLPARARVVLEPSIDGVVAGLGAVGRGRVLAEAGILTLVHWTMGVASLAMLLHGAGIDLPLAASCFTSVAIAVGAALPQAPGYVGVFHSVIENTLLPWEVELARAQAFALVAWAVSFGPVTLSGIVAAWWEGLRPSSLAEFSSAR